MIVAARPPSWSASRPGRGRRPRPRVASARQRGREHVVGSAHGGPRRRSAQLGGLDAEGYVKNCTPCWQPACADRDRRSRAHGRRYDGARGGRRLEAREPQPVLAHGGGRRWVAPRMARSLRTWPSSSPAPTASLHPAGAEAGFAAERAWQLERLVERLGLAGLPPRSADHKNNRAAVGFSILPRVHITSIRSSIEVGKRVRCPAARERARLCRRRRSAEHGRLDVAVR